MKLPTEKVCRERIRMRIGRLRTLSLVGIVLSCIGFSGFFVVPAFNHEYKNRTSQYERIIYESAGLIFGGVAVAGYSIRKRDYLLRQLENEKT